jgi:ABC-type uncharacterized transport system permease subunit
MLPLKIERGPAPIWVRTLIPVAAVPVTFILTSLLLIWAKANPFEAYYQFLVSPLTSPVSALEILVKSTPLLLTGAAVAFAFSAGYWNIGAEGQLYAGALAAAWIGVLLKGIHPLLGIPLMLLGGFLAGALWALTPALLKIRLNVDEVVTTLLLNSVILFLVSYLLNGPWRDPVSMWPQSPAITEGTIFFRLIPRSRLHLGFLVAMAVIIAEWFILTRTALGLRMRAVGKGKTAAQFAGIDVKRTVLTAALVSGGIAGLAGVGEVAGIHFHLIESISDGMGYSGILIATLGGLHPFSVGLAALFFGLIDTGAQTVSRAMNVPVYLGQVVQAVLLLVTLTMLVFQNYRIRRV